MVLESLVLSDVEGKNCSNFVFCTWEMKCRMIISIEMSVVLFIWDIVEVNSSDCQFLVCLND